MKVITKSWLAQTPIYSVRDMRKKYLAILKWEDDTQMSSDGIESSAASGSTDTEQSSRAVEELNLDEELILDEEEYTLSVTNV